MLEGVSIVRVMAQPLGGLPRIPRAALPLPRHPWMVCRCVLYRMLALGPGGGVLILVLSASLGPSMVNSW
jgi:hypothetical protein